VEPTAGLKGYSQVSQHQTGKTRSPAVGRMADRNAPVVKLTFTLTLAGHNLAKKALQIIQTAKAIGLTMAYRKKGPPKVFGMGPPRA